MKFGLHTLSFWFGCLMLLLVISGAIAISFTDFMSERLYGTKRLYFVMLLIAYALYRGYRLYAQLKQQSQNKEDET